MIIKGLVILYTTNISMVLFSENMLFTVIHIFFTNIYIKYGIKFTLCGKKKLACPQFSSYALILKRTDKPSKLAPAISSGAQFTFEARLSPPLDVKFFHS